MTGEFRFLLSSEPVDEQLKQTETFQAEGVAVGSGCDEGQSNQIGKMKDQVIGAARLLGCAQLSRCGQIEVGQRLALPQQQQQLTGRLGGKYPRGPPRKWNTFNR